MDKLIDVITIRMTPEQHSQLAVVASLEGLSV